MSVNSAEDPGNAMSIVSAEVPESVVPTYADEMTDIASIVPVVFYNNVYMTIIFNTEVVMDEEEPHVPLRPTKRKRN
jgi:hypothetical protein